MSNVSRSDAIQRVLGSVISAGVFMSVFFATSAGYAADAEFGRYLASECLTCHGTAKSDSTIPDIFGIPEAGFAEVMKAYRAKSLPNPVMQTVASRLKDDEIAALAAYFATAKKPR